jgi:hypothetical protein
MQDLDSVGGASARIAGGDFLEDDFFFAQFRLPANCVSTMSS